MPCVEIIRAQIGSPYGRRSFEQREAEGFTTVISDVDPRYGSVYLAACTAKSEEECAVLRHLGLACETHGCGGVE